MSEFPKMMMKLRIERGMSQRQAAAELGISQALLSHYENGLREPRLDFLIRACDYYGVPADYMLGRQFDGGEDLVRIAERLRELSAEADRLVERRK